MDYRKKYERLKLHRQIPLQNLIGVATRDKAEIFGQPDVDA
jgi:hypothetical protein